MCMADYADNDGAVSMGSAMARIRKPRRCDECHRDIHPGEYVRVGTWIYEGRWEHMRMCSHCQVVAEWLQKECGGFVWGGVYEDLAEHVEEFQGVYPKVFRQIARLKLMQHRQWRFKRGPAKGMIRPIPMVPDSTSAKGVNDNG